MRSLSLARRLAAHAVGKPPVSPTGRRAAPAARDPQAVRDTLELAARLGESMLSLGASASDVFGTVRDVCRSFDVRCEIDLTFTSILIADDSTGTSVLRVVHDQATDYGRLALVVDLTRSIIGAPSLRGLSFEDWSAAARERLVASHATLDRIVASPHSYRRMLVTLSLSLMAAGVGVLLGGGLLVALVAGVTTLLIDGALRLLTRWQLPPFFLQIVGAALATGVAVLLLTTIPGLPVEFAQLPPSLVVASNIVVLLAGMSLVGAADDAINGFPITASGKLFQVVLLTLGIVVGIGGVLDVARRAGVSLTLIDLPPNPWPVWVLALTSVAISGAWATASYARPRAALVAALAGGGTYLAFVLLTRLGLGVAMASAGAALVLGFVGDSLARRLRVPALVTTVCGIVPLLPGLTIYRGMLDLVSEDGGDTGLGMLLQAGMIGLGLAAGVTLGEVLAQRLRGLKPRHPLRRVRNVTPSDPVPAPDEMVLTLPDELEPAVDGGTDLEGTAAPERTGIPAATSRSTDGGPTEAADGEPARG
ncbi:threonine/serine ThrE exporter family protein [Litorihabitans aurantiacus]|uniref:Threonine/serine exporter family protein n=1 Tax=Litorihabitans aurantiacus TaxID=1930061 RepID=A0AA37XHU4_9MICO|nr:threonine/serine exporter family protein [Litorihabitans aurantiacus]GMA33229.1 hypothetical protein GCM10025875_32210 [Litorihabitans aurantiacus]